MKIFSKIKDWFNFRKQKNIYNEILEVIRKDALVKSLEIALTNQQIYNEDLLVIIIAVMLESGQNEIVIKAESLGKILYGDLCFRYKLDENNNIKGWIETKKKL